MDTKFTDVRSLSDNAFPGSYLALGPSRGATQPTLSYRRLSFLLLRFRFSEFWLVPLLAFLLCRSQL